MSSDDYIQISTILARLKQLAELTATVLNPVKLAELISKVMAQIAHPPPGDPDALENLARAYRSAAGVIKPIGEDTGRLGTTTLPAAWEGGAAQQASEVLQATDRAIDRTPQVFVKAAEALEELADKIRDQQERHGKLHDALDKAWYDATHIRIEVSTPDWLPGPDITIGGDIPMVDPKAVADLAREVARLITGCIDVYTDALDSADRAASRFSDLAGQARAAAGVDGGLSPDDAVVLADKKVTTSMGDAFDDAILTTSQLERAGKKMRELSAQDRARLQKLLDAAKNDEQRAWILKGLAAGHSVDELTPFAEKIRDMDPGTLSEHLSLIDRGGVGKHRRDGDVDVRQYEDTTCGTTSLIIARAEMDPLYALSLTEGNFRENFKAERDRVHEWTNSHRLPGGLPHWPQALGTTPPDMVAYLNEHSGAMGAEYDWRLVDDTNPRDVSNDLRDSLAAANEGQPVPVLVADEIPTRSMHYVLIVGNEGGDVLIFEPTKGETHRVPESDFLNGTLSDSAGFDHVQAVMVPK